MKKAIVIAVLVVSHAIAFAFGIGYSWDHVERVIHFEMEQGIIAGKPFFLPNSDIKIYPRNSSKVTAAIEHDIAGASDFHAIGK